MADYVMADYAADAATPALRVFASFALLLASAAGVLPPLYARGASGDGPAATAPGAMRLKAFAGGTMLSLSVLHVIADAFDRLSPLSEYPWAGVAVLVGVLFMFFVERATLDTLAALEGAESKGNGGSKSNGKGNGKGNGGGGGGGDSHAHGGSRRASPPPPRLAGADEAAPRAESPPAHHATLAIAHAHAHGAGLLLAHHPTARKLATAHLLEASVLVHSLIIGADLGVSNAPRSEVLAFTGVLAVHQLFEGVSLGAVIAELAVPWARKLTLAAAFAVTTPLGVLCGVTAASALGGGGGDANRAKALAGTLDGITGGMLLHMTLQNFIGEEFNRPELATPERRQLRREMYALLVLGVAFMAVLAAWA